MRVVKKVVKGISYLDNEFTPTNMTHFIIGQPLNKKTCKNKEALDTNPTTIFHSCAFYLRTMPTLNVKITS